MSPQLSSPPSITAYLVMVHASRRGVAIAALALAAALRMGRVAPGDEDLAALGQTARERFVPVSDDQLGDARSELAQRAHELERYLGQGSDNGARWLRYLQWDGLQQQLAAEGPPELGTLVAVYRQLNTNQPGLELERFRRASDALRRYIDLAAAAGMANATEAYASQVDALVREAEQYSAAPSAAMEQSIGQRLDFLASLGQSSELVAAVRGRLAQPNALLNVSSSLLDAAIAKPIDRTEPVPDCILGVSIHSTAHTTGTVTVRTVPADDRAVLELTSVGHVDSDNRGTKGPALICSSSQTEYGATKRVEFSDAAFIAHPAQARASLDTNIHSISKKGGGFGSKLVSKIGWKKARESKGQAEAIAEDHAEARIRDRFNEEAADSIADARERYEDNYRTPLVRVGALPDHIRFSTTSDDLAFEVVQASRGQLGAHESPPPLPLGHDAVLRLHETAVNNYAAAVLGGATAKETEPGEKAKFNVALPEWMDKAVANRSEDAADNTSGEPFKPWSLTLRRSRPISVAFADGKVALTIHVARLTSGDESFTRWDVTGTFVPELKDGGAVLHRQGDLVVLPTGFDPQKDQLSSGQVAIRSNLTKVLNERSAQGRGFSQTIEIDRWEPSGDFEDVGPMALEELTSGGGWLTLAWDRQ